MSISGLEASALAAERLKLIAATRAPATTKAYGQAWRNFTRWCADRRVSALPASSDVVAVFVADLIAHGRRPATMALHLSAIAHFHRQACHPAPPDTAARQVIRGARRILAPPRGRAALTPEQLRQMVAQMPATPRGRRDCAILLFGFATALRRSNLVALNLDDLAPPAAAFQPLRSEAVWYVLAVDAGELLGLFAFVPQNSVCWDVHTCLLPVAWGDRARRAARQVAPWIWEHTACRRITTTVPAYNRLALRLARDAGMREFGVNPSSYLKDGKLHDQILLGLSPEDDYAHCGSSASPD